MPRLLIINITCNQGSTGKISEQVGLMMKQRGWEVYLAHGARRVNPSALSTIAFSSVITEYLHALKSLFFVRIYELSKLNSCKNLTKSFSFSVTVLYPDHHFYKFLV